MSVQVDGTGSPGGVGTLERVFKLHERGSTYAREVRGGLATFFTMAYILVLNPIILGGAKDKFGHTLDHTQLVPSTAVVAGVMTLIMGLGGNLPLAIAAGLGLNGVVAFTLAPTMSWPDAMGLVVLEGPQHAVAPYDAILLVEPRRAQDAALRDALQSLVGAINVEAMRAANLNAASGGAQASPDVVANWLWEQILLDQIKR